MSHARVTALLPAYQAAEFIQPTLDSLSAQACPGFSVVISVDACDDDTARICTEHAAIDSRFRVFRQDKRLGYVGNCNFLLGQAHSEYALFAFHDDVLDSLYVEKLVGVLDRTPDAVMAFSDMSLTYVDGRNEILHFDALEGMDDAMARGALMFAQVPLWWVPNRGVFRRPTAERIGGLKTHGAGEFSADWPWLSHMSLLGRFVRCPEVLCFKYYQAGSLSRSWEFSKRQQYEVGLSGLREIRRCGLPFPAKLRLAWPVLRRLARMRRKMLKRAIARRLRRDRGRDASH